MVTCLQLQSKWRYQYIFEILFPEMCSFNCCRSAYLLLAFFHPCHCKCICILNSFSIIQNRKCSSCKYWNVQWFFYFPKLVMLVGTKLQHVVSSLALEIVEQTGPPVGTQVKPRDDLFWFGKPEILLRLIQFIIFQVEYLSLKFVIYLVSISFFMILTSLFCFLYHVECLWDGNIYLVLGNTQNLCLLPI